MEWNGENSLSIDLFCPGVYFIPQLIKILNNIFQLLKPLDDVIKTVSKSRINIMIIFQELDFMRNRNSGVGIRGDDI